MTTVVATLTLMTTLSFGRGAPGRPTVTGQQNPPATQTATSIDADAIRQRVKEGQQVRTKDRQRHDGSVCPGWERRLHVGDVWKHSAR